MACAPNASALTNGDVALVFFTADGNDALAFVALTNIPASTTLYFSDLGWTNATRRYSTTEGKIRWSHSSSVNAGTVVVITNLASGTVSANVGTGVREGSFNLAGTDSLLVSQSNAVSGIWHMFGSKWTAAWGSDTGTAFCQQPTELADASMVFTTADNFRFNRTLTNGTKAQLLAAITNTANWTITASGAPITNLPFTVNDPVSSSPEISIRGTNLAEIASGDVTPVYSDGTDFGAVSAAGTPAVTNTFGITNSGTAILTISGVTTSSAMGAAADFVVLNWPASVSAGTRSNLVIKFDPAASGVRTALVSVANNDTDEGTYTFVLKGTGTAPEIAVSGNGTDITDGDVSPTTTDHTDFSTVLVAGGTVVRTFTITNSGNESLTVNNVTTSGTHMADFVVTAQPSSPVAAGGFTTFQVTFNPSAAGVRSAALSFANGDADENPFNFSIQGTGTEPEIGVSGNGVNIADGDGTPSTLDGTDYGSVLIGNTLDQTFVITNTGSATLTLGSVTTSGTHMAEFVVVTQPSGTLAVSNSTTIVLRFAPTGSGTRSAAISFTTDDADENPFNFSVQGSGVSAAPNMILLGTNLATIANGDVTPSASDGSDFAAVAVAGGTASRTFTITNSGNASLTVSAVTTSGTHASEFRVTTAPGGSVAAGATTTFIVQFDPADRGLRSATFSIANNDGPNNPYTFGVQGTGTAPEIAVSGNGSDIVDGDATPSTGDHTDFGSMDVDVGTVVRTFTVTNTGNATLTLGSVTVGGTHAADFSVTAALAGTLAVSNGTTFQVTFNPSATGVRSATLSFSTDDPDENPFNFSIQGTGTVTPEISVRGTNGAEVADGDVTPDAADGTDFGAALSGGGTVDRTLSITNSGSGLLTISGVTTSGTHAADFRVISFPATVSPYSRSNLVLRFAPSAGGTRSGTITIANNDADEASYDFAVRGTGQVEATVSTTIATATNTTTATAGGNVSSEGGASVTNRGVVWASTATPTVPGQQTTNVTAGTGAYSATLTNLTPGATYYYRAFAQNIAGTSYGTEYTLTTPCFAGVVTGVMASATNSTGFTASWSNFAGATGYALDVSTNSAFGGAGGVTTNLWEDFINFTTSESTEITSSLNSYTRTAGWTGERVYAAASQGRAKMGTSSARGVLITPTVDLSANGGNAEVRFDAASWSGDGTVLQVYHATNGTTFSQVGGNITLTESMATYTSTITGGTASSKIRFYVQNTSNERYYLDNIYVTQSASAPSYVPGYSNLAVAGTSQAVSGLDQGVTYYFRVRATNDFCTTADSSTGSVTTLVTAAPEMAILGTNLAVIVDNDVSPSLLDGTDFGDVSTASATKDHTFTVTNAGTATLTLSNIVISGAAAGDYAVQTGLGSSSLAAGATTTFTIRFDPSAAGARNATISLANNDSDENPYNFDITGNGVAPAPEIAVLGSNLAEIPVGDTTPSTADGTDFGAVSVASGTSVTTFTITNSGSATLTVSGVTTSGAHAANFRITNGPASTVAAGATTTFVVEFDPSVYGGRTGIISIANNDSDKNPYTFTVRGDGVITLPEALDNVSLVWTTRGPAVWFGQAPTNHDGVDAAQSGLVTHNQTSTLETVVFGPGEIAFWWQVSSEDGYDYLNFQIDGVEQDFLTGFMPWNWTNFAIPAGVHTVRWDYVKDVSDTAGADAGWVDEVTYTAGSPLSGFTLNGTGANLTDAQLAVAVTVRVNIADADGINWNGATIAPSPNISPYLSISNPAGAQILAPVAFGSGGHTDGETATTVTGVVTVSSVTTGSPFRVNVLYADNVGNLSTGEFSFAVTDDDVVPPQVSDVTVYGIRGWSAGAGGVVTNINTSFEDADGWADQSGGNWTESANDGDWISIGCYANANNTHAGTRKIGLNDVGDSLQLPPVADPVTVSAWLRLSGAGSDTIRLEYKDGASWVAVSNRTVSSTTYSQHFWTLSNSGVTTLRFYAVSAGNSFYLDNVQVVSGATESWPKSALAPGDLFVTGFNADGDSDFSVLTFVDIAGGTEIRFTDYGWSNANFTAAAEGVITYTAPTGGLPAGSVVLFTNFAAGSGFGVSAGSATKSGSFNFSGSGDQLLAYQVTPGVTSFVFALSTDSTNWNATSSGANYSEIPPGLAAGTNAVHTRALFDSGADIDCGVALKVAGSPAQVRAQLLSATNWAFTETGPYALSAAPHSGGIVYDGVLTNAGYGVTATVFDVTSGILRDGADGARYSILGPDGSALVSGSALIGGLASNGAARTATVISASGAAIAPASIALGAYTALVQVADFDQDRTGDSLGATGRVWFTVIDDDTNAPAITGFRLSGNSTNYDTGVGGNLVLTGLVTETQSPVFSGGFAYFLVRDQAGGVLASNNLFAGAGSAATGTWSSPVLDCGIDVTVMVYAADADLDRGVADQSLAVATALVFRTTGVGGPADYPTASNLLVSGVAAAPATAVFDETIRTGGWSLAFSLSHPVGVFTNATSPSFRVTNAVGEVLGGTPWSNGVLSGQTYFFTNASLPAVGYAQVATGLHHVVWSASNQGSCVASIVDREVFGGGTNVFTVVDDDTDAPVLSGFAVQGGGTTLGVDAALTGFAITGLVQDAGSGVALATAPPYALFYSLAGAVLASNSFTGGADGAGKLTPVALTNWFSGLTLACGNSYTVRVFAADADDDRPGDRASATGLALVVQTSGAGGDAPTAQDLRINGTAASSVSLTDHAIFLGGWTMALTMAHSTDAIVTNGPDAPTFTVFNAAGSNLYAASPLGWSNIVRSGLNYFATNAGFAAGDTNRIDVGSYSIVWSAQSEGLCFGSAAGSGTVSPGTNRFTVVDDDTIPPNLYGLSVAGGTGTGGGGGGGCLDPTATNLNAGDIAIFAMNTKTRGVTNNDSFAFVALVDIPTGTRIKFTDNGWSASQNAFRNNEGTLTWMATGCVAAGSVVRWIATNHPTLNHGLIIATNGNFAPNIQGEQILAYQGADSAPNFLYAINDRQTGVWDLDAVDSHSSAIPPGLIDGYTCVAVIELDNVILNTNNLAITGDREQILYYVGDRENWIGSDDSVYDLLAFNFTFPDAGEAIGGTITDHDILQGGWSITGLVQDVGSGVAVSNGPGLRYEIFNTNGGLALANYFTTTFTNGSKLLHGYSNAMPAGVYANIQLGVYTARVTAGDADADRINDSSERITNVPFTVVDDDTDLPQIGYFTLNGQTAITNAADLLGVVISGQVRDVTSGIAFQSAPPSFEVLDSLGSVALSGSFAFAPTADGDGVDWTNIWTTPLNLGGIADCGVYTVRVTVADADDDRPGDRRATNQYFLISVATGSGDAPTASNLLVNATAATAATLTDAQLAAGGWSLAVELHHPGGLLVDPPNAPSFEFRDPAGAALFDQDWSNLTTLGTTVFATNEGLPGVAYADVTTGYHAVVWSGRSQGSCYGEALDSAMIRATNRFLVLDDDTVGPNAPTSTASTASTWTNNPVITVTWDTGSVFDASGVASYRFSTNAPATAAAGLSAGLTNRLVITNHTEGIHTNWLFALDADNDRPGDAAMGEATGIVLQLDFTAPDQVTGLAGEPGAADNTSQIDLDWTALPNGGNPNLSPWSTYRVYYTQNAGAPTTNDTFVDAGLYPDLATNITTAVTLAGLAMGSEYRVAMAGVDRAGNVGPLSDAVSVTLGQIVITQALANAQSQPSLWWSGAGSAFYDVIYADDTGYSSRVDSKWKLAKTVAGTTFTDEGGINDGDGAVRVAPMNLAAGMMRFYRVAAPNSWIPSAGRAGGATTQIIVALKSTLSNGYNFVGMGMTPMVNTLGDFLGTNRLPWGDSMATSTVVTVYAPTASGQPQTNAWWLSSDGEWQYEMGGAADTQALPYPFTGYNVMLPTNRPPTNLLLVGRVPWTNLPSFSLEPQKYHVITLNAPRPTKMSELGMRDILTRGTSVTRSDEIRIMQRGLGPYTSPRARIYINMSGQYTFGTGGSGSAENFVIQPDDAVVVYTPKLSAPVVWAPALPFEFPKVQITNALAAPPTVLAQTPLDVTFTAATLRGLVNPNGLATVARIDYGTTTNYGSTIALTNLPATNFAWQVAGPVAGLSTGTLYHFRVWASNSAGVSRFGTGSFATLGVCTNAAASATAVTVSDGASTAHAALTWGDVAGEDGYAIYRNTINDSGSASWLASVASDTTAWNDTTAVAGQLYYYWLKATNCAGASAFGAGDSGYRKLATVAGLAATYNTLTNAVRLAWTDGAGETGYAIWRHTADAYGSASYLAAVAAGVTNFDDTAAVANTDYYYWVRATNTTSASQGDAQASGALGRRSNVGVPELAAPTFASISTTGAVLGATVTGNGGATLTARGTVWGYASNPTGNSQAEGGTAVSAFTHARGGMTPGSLVYFRGWASNSVGLGYSAESSFWTAPVAPTGLHATNSTTNGFTLAWTPSAGATNYLLDIASDPGFTTFVGLYTGKSIGAAASHGVTGLAPSGTNYVRLRAQNSGGIGPNSLSVTGYTLASAPWSQASNITFSVVGYTNLAIAWSAGSGAGRMLVARQGGSIVSHPEDGANYAASSTFGLGGQVGAGHFVVYKGTGSTVAISGLASNTSYFFRLYEYSGGGAAINYATNNAANNPAAQATLPLGCPGIAVYPISLPAGTNGTFYSKSLTASNGVPGYSFAVTSGALPPNLVLMPNGALSGTLVSAGTNLFTVTATDTNGCTGLRNYTFTTY